jgi:hypothetical protein
VKNSIACPSCGHRHRIPNDRLGGKVTCMACGEVFEARGSKSKRSAPEPVEGKPPKRPGAGQRVIQRLWGDVTVLLEGAIPGALSGIVVGVLIGILYLGTDNRSPEALGGAIGEAFTRVVHGIGFGVGLGPLIGAAVVAIGRLLRGGKPLTPTWAALSAGVVTGFSIAAIIGDWHWGFWGAGFGAGVASLWQMLWSKAEAAMVAKPYPRAEPEEEEVVDSKGRRRREQVYHLGDPNDQMFKDVRKYLRPDSDRSDDGVNGNPKSAKPKTRRPS